MTDLYKLIQDNAAKNDDLLKGRVNLSLMMCGGVYLLSNSERVLYIGETICFAQRIASHLAEGRIPFGRVEVIYMSDPMARIDLEQTLIGRFQPPYNRHMRRGGDNRNVGNQFAKPGYVSTMDKANIIDPEFDE